MALTDDLCPVRRPPAFDTHDLSDRETMNGVKPYVCSKGRKFKKAHGRRRSTRRRDVAVGWDVALLV